MNRERVEKWISIKGYEGFYSISPMGDVRRDAPGNGTFVGKILKFGYDTKGYRIVGLSVKGIARTYPVHVLVARMFIGERPKGLDINHKDTNRENNFYKNLEYITHGDNIRHAHACGLVHYKRGEDFHASIFRNEDIIEIRRMWKEDNISQSDIARLYGASPRTICGIVRRQHWKHL